MMILNNVNTVNGAKPVNIRINGHRIAEISAFPITVSDDTKKLTFENALAFPGLINSHDHLDFNLFPKLGNTIYNNYTEWGRNLHENFKDEIQAVLKIPQNLRSQWGVYKNLICGVTTVVNHGEKLKLGNHLITVFQHAHNLHSVKFEKNWKIKLNNPLKINLPVVMHVGEGEDWPAFYEISQLISWNLLKKQLIGVHAVAMSEKQAKKFRAIVWCPESNYFLLNNTAKVNFLKKHTNILFGTDSTLTSTWNIWDHLRLARKTLLLDDKSLYNSLTQNAAGIWKLNCGEIVSGKNADIVVARIKDGKTNFDSFYELGPEDILLIIHNGKIRLFDESIKSRLKETDINGFSAIYLNNSCKYVEGDLPGLMEKIKAYHPTVVFPVHSVANLDIV